MELPLAGRAALVTGVSRYDTHLADIGADLADPSAPRSVVDAAAAVMGHLDILVWSTPGRRCC